MFAVVVAKDWSLVHTIGPLASQYSPARSFQSFISQFNHLYCSKYSLLKKTIFFAQGRSTSSEDKSHSTKVIMACFLSVFPGRYLIFCIFSYAFVFLIQEIFWILFSSFIMLDLLFLLRSLPPIQIGLATSTSVKTVSWHKHTLNPIPLLPTTPLPHTPIQWHLLVLLLSLSTADQNHCGWKLQFFFLILLLRHSTLCGSLRTWVRLVSLFSFFLNLCFFI